MDRAISLRESFQKMISAVSETEKHNPALWGMGVVAITLAVHFLHSLAQKELSYIIYDSHLDISPVILTGVLAALQVAAALSIFRVSGLDLSTSTNREAAIIGVLAYFGGLFLHNYLVWNEDTAAVASCGVLEPVLCVALLYIAARIPTETHKVESVICFSFGAVLLTAKISSLGNVNGLLGVLASLYFIVRNLVVKHLYDTNVTFCPRSHNTMLTVMGVGTLAAIMLAAAVGEELIVAGMMVGITGVLSVLLLYLMLWVLAMYDTLTVAVFMLWGQVIENVIFVDVVSRPVLLSVLIGAALFAGGHYIYFKDGLESGTVHLNIKEVGVNELFTRVQFIMYVGSFLGLVATLLQPFVSERDLNVLSYVGLDRLARKLLNVRPAADN